MLACVRSMALIGIDAYRVDVEVDATAGLPAFATVGLAQSAIKEGKERVVSAIRNVGLDVPPRKITINLAPANVRKEGSHFDLPIACGLLAATGQVGVERLEGYAVAGELGLDGSLRPIRGALPMACAVRRARLAGLIVPDANLREAAVIEDLDVRGASTLDDVVGFLRGRTDLVAGSFDAGSALARPAAGGPDLADIHGQFQAKRALEIAAAGAHNVLLVGPPGAGKTMLARRLPTIMPGLTLGEAIEVTTVHSVAGQLSRGSGLVTSRPFRAPHHTISDAGLIGGGPMPRPGEVSLAHHGVLFLDELPEFRRNVLEVLRQPLEDGRVRIARSALTVSYPARFLLAAAMNPCPCGYRGDGRRPCRCTPSMLRRYHTRVSGPLLDRIDLQVEMPAVSPEELADTTGNARDGTPSMEIAVRVDAARRRQQDRFQACPGVYANAQMSVPEVRRYIGAGEAALAVVRDAMARFGFSARSYHRILKVARTIADLAGSEAVECDHVAEAIQYRGLDRRWGGRAT